MLQGVPQCSHLGSYCFQYTPTIYHVLVNFPPKLYLLTIQTFFVVKNRLDSFCYVKFFGNTGKLSVNKLALSTNKTRTIFLLKNQCEQIHLSDSTTEQRSCEKNLRISVDNFSNCFFHVADVV